MNINFKPKTITSILAPMKKIFNELTAYEKQQKANQKLHAEIEQDAKHTGAQCAEEAKSARNVIDSLDKAFGKYLSTDAGKVISK